MQLEMAVINQAQMNIDPWFSLIFRKNGIHTIGTIYVVVNPKELERVDFDSPRSSVVHIVLSGKI